MNKLNRTAHEDRPAALRSWVHAKRNKMLFRAVDLDIIDNDQAHALFDLWDKMDDE